MECLPDYKGYFVIMVVVTRLSNYAHFIAIKLPFVASTVASLFLSNVFKLHGMPKSIVSDRGFYLYKFLLEGIF